MARDFLNLVDAGGDAIASMIADAIDRKAARKAWPLTCVKPASPC